MSSELKALGAGILVGLGIAGLVLPWYVEVRGFFGPASASGGAFTDLSWAVLIGIKPPFFPFPVWLRFPSKGKKRRNPRADRDSAPRCPARGGTHLLNGGDPGLAGLQRSSSCRDDSAYMGGKRRDGGSLRFWTGDGKRRIHIEDIRRYAGEALYWLRYLGSRFELLDLKVRLELGLGDAASTALVAGGLLALVRSVLPLVSRRASRQVYRGVRIVPVYDRTALGGHFLVKGRIRTIHLLAAAMKLLPQLLRIRRLWTPRRSSGIPGILGGKIVPSRKAGV